MKPLLKKYQELRHPTASQITDTPNGPVSEFPLSEYEELMHIIDGINHTLYETLRKCENTLGKPCLQLGGTFMKTTKPSEESQGYPLIVLPTHIRSENEEGKKWWLGRINDYKRIPIMPKEERMHYLEIIKSLTPQLYEEFVAIDPTGFHHLKPLEEPEHFINACVRPSLEDGLPIISIGKGIQMLPREQQRCILRHELGHYVLGHYKGAPAFHKKMRMEMQLPPFLTVSVKKKVKEKIEMIDDKPIIINKEVSAPLEFPFTFKDASHRVNEFEADRFAAMNFETDIDEMLALERARTLMYITEYPAENPERETFFVTHPEGRDRIKQLLSLRKELEFCKAKGEQPAPIDWKALREKYAGTTWDTIE